MDQQVQVQDDELVDYSDRDADRRQSTIEEGIGSSNNGCNGRRARDKFSKLFFVRQVVFGGQNSGRHLLSNNNKPHINKESTESLSSGGGGLRRQTSSVPKELDSTPAPQGGGSPARRMSNAVFSSFTSAATFSSTGSSKAGDNNTKTKEALRKSQQQGPNPFSFF